jgi:poly-beta-hydroxyalkanoate depolymerase
VAARRSLAEWRLGVFSGQRWQNKIYPILKSVILSGD